MLLKILALLLVFKDCGVLGCFPNPFPPEPTEGQVEGQVEKGEAPIQKRDCRTKSDCRKGHKCMASNCVLDVRCPKWKKFGDEGPPSKCTPPSDPNENPPNKVENWLTKEVFDDLFPKANIGWGPNSCWPYSYEAFVIAARYFPEFGAESPDNGYSATENSRRDLAAFFSHAIQETGENDASLYEHPDLDSKQKSDACFYRGGFFNWFEGGPISSFLKKGEPGYTPEQGAVCIDAGKYCSSAAELDYWFPCNNEKDGEHNKGCYFGRGAIQISYNFNYGNFQRWLAKNRIFVDLLKEPNLVMTKMDPPLAVLASLWFYMTPQPPKPAMHDIVMGNWEPGDQNRAEGYEGPIFGPTSLVINNECNGEDEGVVGGPGESRRIKAFKWFCGYLNVPVEEQRLLSCGGMPQKLDQIKHPKSWQPDWTTSWKEVACDCAPANYGGMIPYFEPGFYPDRFVRENLKNRIACVYSIYNNPSMYSMNNETSLCLNQRIPAGVKSQFKKDPTDPDAPAGPKLLLS